MNVLSSFQKSYTDEFGVGLVGQRVNIWWPLDKT